MDECLHLQPCLPPYPGNLFKGDLSGGNHPAASEILQELRAPYTGNRHLGAGMQLHPREMLPHHPQRSEILNNHAVHSLPVKRRHILHKPVQLILFKQCIHRHVQTAAMEVDIINRAQKALFVRILRIGPGPKARASHIGCIRSRGHSRPQAVQRTGWRQKLHFFLISHLLNLPSSSTGKSAAAYRRRLSQPIAQKDASGTAMRHPRFPQSFPQRLSVAAPAAARLLRGLERFPHQLLLRFGRLLLGLCTFLRLLPGFRRS